MCENIKKCCLICAQKTVQPHEPHGKISKWITILKKRHVTLKTQIILYKIKKKCYNYNKNYNVKN